MEDCAEHLARIQREKLSYPIGCLKAVKKVVKREGKRKKK